MAKPPLLSLPVHERPDIVADQIANLRRFCPEALICLHLSAGYEGDPAPFQALATVPGVLFNPRRLDTVRDCGLFHVHVSNFLHAISAHPELGRVCLISSNELLVRHGLAEHLDAYHAGAQVQVYDPATDWHLFAKRVDTLPEIAELLRFLGLPTIFGGQAEGQFYDANLFLDIATVFMRFLPLAPYRFQTEEVLPQTIALSLLGQAGRVTLPFTLQNYCNAFSFNPDLIELIRTGRGWVFGPRRLHHLASPHIGTHDLSSIFSIKRVPREFCALRQFISGLT